MESNLLKEAIADAKAVRNTALLNAKVALEEAFSERYTEMFAQKLKEDAEIGEGAPVAPAAGAPVASGSEIDELIKELENEVNPESPAGEPDLDDAGAIPPAPAAGAVPPAPVPGAVPPMGAPTGQMVLCPVGQVATAAMPPAPAPAPLDGAVPPMGAPAPVGGEIPPAPVGGDMGASTPPPSETPPVGGEEETDENIDLNALLESLKEEMEKDEKGEEKGEKCDETIAEDKKLASSGIATSDNKKPSSSASSSSKIESGGIKNNGVPSPDSTKTGPEDATKAARPNEAKNATSTNLSTPSMGGTSGPALKASRPNQGKNATATNLSTPGGMLEEENKSLKKQLSEAYETVTYIKKQLNEVNVLNAKLLYTNKLFKEYNMNNEQKMRIVEMFDLARDVREVKLTYANYADSLSFGGTSKRKVAPATNATVQNITEGIASMPVGSTKPSQQIISESKNSIMVAQFQKLAGIKKS